MNRRGHALALMVAVTAALAVGGAVTSMRLSSNMHARRHDDIRLQALWLARSAVSAGLTGSREVETPLGVATVQVARQGAALSVVVELEGSAATLVSEPYTERFTTVEP